MNAWLTLNDRKGAVCRALLAAVSGAAATLGFAPYGLWFMTVIGGAAVFYAVEKSRSVREAAGLGWLWGVTYFATGSLGRTVLWPFTAGWATSWPRAAFW